MPQPKVNSWGVGGGSRRPALGFGTVTVSLAAGFPAAIAGSNPSRKDILVLNSGSAVVQLSDQQGIGDARASFALAANAWVILETTSEIWAISSSAASLSLLEQSWA
ncbi:MAG: hypothetical protein ACR2MO_08630 [Acidimicrobiales bacterium]